MNLKKEQQMYRECPQVEIPLCSVCQLNRLDRFFLITMTTRYRQSPCQYYTPTPRKCTAYLSQRGRHHGNAAVFTTRIV